MTSQVFFTGAGLSVAAGYPVTSGLTHAIAHYLSGYRKRHLKRSRLEGYLTTVYGVTRTDIEAGGEVWSEFLRTGDGAVLRCTSRLPDVIELLSVLDFTIQSNLSFGPGKGGDELAGRELSRIRERVLRAFVRCFSEIRQKSLAKSAKALRDFAMMVHDQDAIVLTTNWDMVLDDCLISKTFVPDYGVSSPILTDASGNKLPKRKVRGCLLKLHGAVNWLCCPRCGDLWINTELAIAPGAEHDGKNWFDRESFCGAEMDGLMITPSFVRIGSNLHLSNIANRAQRALAAADQWTFVGYSLPDDDYWIRAMLLRARAIQRSGTRSPKVTVVYKAASGQRDESLENRYTKFFGGLDPRFEPEGVEALLAKRRQGE